jgi:hypothetical protein
MDERQRIRAILIYALRYRARSLMWKRNDDSQIGVVADSILAHLELSNVELRMKAPVPPHSAD